MIELTAADGHCFSAYRADPVTAPKGAVIVLQETLGVNAHIRKLTDDFATQGYAALAPALFDRVRSGVELSHEDNSLAEGRELMKQISPVTALADIQATIDALKSAGKIAVIGYGWGAYLAYQAGNQLTGLACAIGYYGDGIADEWRGKRKIPTLLHFGIDDAAIPFEQVRQFRANRPDVCVYDYPAAHDFNCDQSSGFNADAAQLAWHRTLFWISQFVEGQQPLTLKNAGSYAQAKTDKKKKQAMADNDLGPPAE